VLGLLIHFGFGYLLTLSVDEAHYVMYAAIPAWSYFDHPPLVGWIQWPLVALDAPDGIIRLIPQLLWLAACLLARALAFNLYDRQHARLSQAGVAREAVGLWAVGLVLLAPVMHVLAVGLLPDSLLMVLILLLMQVTLRLTETDPQSNGLNNRTEDGSRSVFYLVWLGFQNTRPSCPHSPSLWLCLRDEALEFC
jgi:4-amino-4-deoxy-L-arabinose transferase-like glycosyltransferase